ncbi:MAG: hypothetical protein ABL993_02490 [Vicinamibacterales bacterium]
MSRLSRAFVKFSVAAKVGTPDEIAKWEAEYIEALHERLAEHHAKAKAAQEVKL